MMNLPAYDIHQSYEWNYQHAPDPVELDVPACPGNWTFCGYAVNSPLGMPAGPLLNSRWILYYAALGFDTLVYKTVRSRFRASYDPPNLLPLEHRALHGEGSDLQPAAAGAPFDTWAISFGMPSRDPAEWRADVERARRGLRKGQILVVSVVASPGAGWTLDDVARDFALCAEWAEEAGAQVVEANLSCPNVCTQEADLYLSAEASGVIAGTVRSRLKRVPLALKVGLFHHEEQAARVVEAVSPYAAALSATNSITATVSQDGRKLFDGLRRGIGGGSITARCLEELRMLKRVIGAAGSPLELVSVGGVMTAQDVTSRLEAGARNVQLATAPMLDPLIGVRIREQLAQR
jgi:dihydroorotate dehydrogenase